MAVWGVLGNNTVVLVLPRPGTGTLHCPLEGACNQEKLAMKVVEFVQALRKLPLKKSPSIAETIDWARTIVVLNVDLLDAGLVADTLNVLLKYEQDVQKVREKLPGLLPAGNLTGDLTVGGTGHSTEGSRGAAANKMSLEKKSAVKTRMEEIMERFDF